jgi:ribonucleoside-diphosphate reductase alpha chain
MNHSMISHDKGKEFLSQLKLYSDYLKWDPLLNRYETWKEACDKVLDTHRMKYGPVVEPLLEEVAESYYAKEFLSSQRNLQFRGEQILRNNAKIYNCCTTYAYAPDVFNKGFFVLLSGTGLGVSLRNKFVSQLPVLHKRSAKVKPYIVPDSIEGWSEAIKVLISSYCHHPSLYNDYFRSQIKFDYSEIRPMGSAISGGFKAPGPDGLKQSLERIESLLDQYIGDAEHAPFKSIIAYDVFMHLSDAVLSGGVRRSAMNIIMDPNDEDLIRAKTGHWRQTHPWRARSNNSVGLLRHTFSYEAFNELVSINEGDNDLGFVFMSHEDEMFNPCYEIGFNFYEQIKNRQEAVFQFCNLNELNASACVNGKGEFSEEKFYDLCRKSAILGTLQAGYTTFPYLGKQTEALVAGEALLGISITGWMTRPELFNEKILQQGAEIVKQTNQEVAALIGIRPAARTTTVKPSGNASVILKTASGIHPEHSKRYFRIMQLNKESETAKYMQDHYPEMLEESLWSNTSSDWVVYVPCENPDNVIIKDEMHGVKHLKLIELVQNSWVRHGKNEAYCYNKLTNHNVSNTVIIDDKKEVVDYIFNHQDNFTAVSFMSRYGDKDYAQAPFTSVLNTEEIVSKYGDASIFMSGLIVDGLHYFNNDLWAAVKLVKDPKLPIPGSRSDVLLKKDWLRRVKQFSHNYFNGDTTQTIYCMKDVHLWHKWVKIKRHFKLVDFVSILKEPEYMDVSKTGAIACSGGVCEI